MAHSKRNTSRSIFTSHERQMAKAAWGASSARLSSESFLPFASCSLCLEPAIDPVACATGGDIFCRECALSNILAQKKEIKRLEKAREQEERDAAEQQVRQDAEAQERAIREFELTQAGLDVSATAASRGSGLTTSIADPKTKAERKASTSNPHSVPSQDAAESSSAGGRKRKFSLDADEVARIASEERAKARKAIDDEKAAKPTLPSFWAPSVTPSSNKNNTLHDVKRKTKLQPTCPASQEDRPHCYSLHSLVTVNFAEEEKQRICPACKKALSNAGKAVLAKPCGHVLCKSCVDKFMKPDPHEGEGVRCFVCEADLTERKEKKEGKGEKEKMKPGLVELRSEGTGYAAGGANQVKKSGVVFQC
ncbi:hypothetical protein QBC46DRAFT_354236 [Diplogelasinospora grovesii]|uniref:RING-type domain-containing protein n=1 Tax=Diplogelasinospora grovesii TaxID=303347 RepID=A0AAN6S5A5_9PEZI|nr:hypothetical protein QBC46DRAFT_354236 [Diplogelasinospora grovesii]